MGAAVYLYAASSTGYGGNGIAPSIVNASISLLNANVLVTSPLNSGVDGSGHYYVTTDSGGSFSITGDYTCTAGQQVYVYVVGGNPGAGVNSAAGLLSLLGNCPGGTLATQVPYLRVNEVTTIAAAYAFAGFASDATHVSSSGTAAAQTGIANAFGSANNLASLTTGDALTTTPAGNATAPQGEINTLANILASCVNSSSPTSSTCSTLFLNAKSGGSTGTTASDTATAAINIAHNPGTNVAALYGIPPPTLAFGPTLSAKPNDFTVAINITGNGLNAPRGMAIDGVGNVWVTNDVGSSVSKFTPLGSAAAGSPFAPPGSGLAYPVSVAIDLNGNAWIPNCGSMCLASSTDGNTVTELSNSGALLSGAPYAPPGSGLGAPQGVAIDASGNAWIANSSVNDITELSSGGALVTGAPYAPPGLQSHVGIAIDSAGAVWVTDTNTSKVTKLTNAGANASGSPFAPNGSGLNVPEYIAIDAAGNAWITNTLTMPLRNFPRRARSCRRTGALPAVA